MKAVRLLAVVVALFLAVCGGTAAYAYFRVTPTVSTGSASSSTGTALTILPGTPVAALYPGGTAPIALTIVNPGSDSTHVTSLSLDTGQGTFGFAVDASHSGCSTSSLSYVTQTTGWDVPAHGSLSVTLPASALTMSTSAANACQGALITVYLKAA